MGEQLPNGKGKQASPNDPKQATEALCCSQTQVWCSKISLETLGNEAERVAYAQKAWPVYKENFLHVYLGRLVHHEPKAVRREVRGTLGWKGADTIITWPHGSVPCIFKIAI